jgi:ubiquinone biosynthesis protein UbiJ
MTSAARVQDEQGNGWVPLATYHERCDEIADLKKRLGRLEARLNAE